MKGLTPPECPFCHTKPSKRWHGVFQTTEGHAEVRCRCQMLHFVIEFATMRGRHGDISIAAMFL
jgi:hypothetical protein